MKNTIKAAVTVAFTTIFSFLGILATPIFLLLGCNIIDYITGLAAAAYRNPDVLRPITSYKSIKGIAKKVCMYLLVIVGWMVDTMINAGLAQSPYNIQVPYIVATAVACWLIFNEMISILENMTDIGVNIPPFLFPLLKMMQKKQEDIAQVEDKEDADVQDKS
jgi:toxin secretion/phage lysis holin